jgi:hypothetical protein
MRNFPEVFPRSDTVGPTTRHLWWVPQCHGDALKVTTLLKFEMGGMKLTKMATPHLRWPSFRRWPT